MKTTEIKRPDNKIRAIVLNAYTGCFEEPDNVAIYTVLQHSDIGTRCVLYILYHIDDKYSGVINDRILKDRCGGAETFRMMAMNQLQQELKDNTSNVPSEWRGPFQAAINGLDDGTVPFGIDR